MEKLAEKVATEYGVVDVLVNNAGIGLSGSFLDTTPEDWRKVLDVNLWGVIHGCRLFGRQMAERGQGGHIVNTASAAAYLPSRALPAYSTSKAAVLMLSECLRAELAGQGIGVSAICPGIVNTNITSTARFAGRRRRGGEAPPAEAPRGCTDCGTTRRRRSRTPILRAVVRNQAVVPGDPGGPRRPLHVPVRPAGTARDRPAGAAAVSPQDKRNNVPHLPLPAGERWFAKVAGEGLPLAAAHVPRPGA